MESEKYQNIIRNPEKEQTVENAGMELYLAVMNAGSSREVALRYVTHIMARTLDTIGEMENQTIN